MATFSKRLIRSVSGLALCFVGMAGLYYYLHSPFLALMQIVIYVGAICIMIMFTMMLAEPRENNGCHPHGCGSFRAGAGRLLPDGRRSDFPGWNFILACNRAGWTLQPSKTSAAIFSTGTDWFLN